MPFKKRTEKLCLIQPWHLSVDSQASEVLRRDLRVFSSVLPTSHCFFITPSPKESPKNVRICAKLYSMFCCLGFLHRQERSGRFTQYMFLMKTFLLYICYYFGGMCEGCSREWCEVDLKHCRSAFFATKVRTMPHTAQARNEHLHVSKVGLDRVQGL